MKKLWWSTLCILLLFACTTPEKKAKKILDEFSKELRVITDVENLSAYDLSNCIDKAYARLEENQKKARKELKKAEQKELTSNWQPWRTRRRKCGLMPKVKKHRLCL